MTLKRVFWTVGLFGLFAFAWALYVRFFVHPDASNLGSVVPWGLHIAQYIYFVGLSAGSFLISSLVYVFGMKRFEPIGRLAVFTAIVTLLLALLTVGLDIGHIERAWHVFVFVNPRSPMAWMIWLYSIYLTLLIVEFWFLMRRDMVVASHSPGWRGRLARILALGSRNDSDASLSRDMRYVKIAATIGVPLAIMFHGGVGALFGVLAARPYWHTPLFPVIFIVSALASGGALLVVASAIFQEGWKAHREMIIDLGRLVLGFLLLDIGLQISEILIGLYGADPSYLASFFLIVAGPYWFVFWIVQLGFGVLVPLICLATPLRHDPRAVVVGCAAIVIGFVGVRLNIILPGMSPEEIRGLTDAVSDPRVTSDYFPSTWEWILSFGIMAFGLVIFGLGEIFLPLSHHLNPAAGDREADHA
jgi:molybdopterin-containing oxidoreductase family membrane subunit